MHTKVISALVLAAATFLPQAAIAAADPPTSASASGRDLRGLENRWGLPLTFNSFDANRDGYVSRQEAGASPLLASQFDQLDKDRDGKLSPEELGAAVQEAPATAMNADRVETHRSR